MQLTNGQKWVFAAFITSAITMGNTFFITGQMQTFGYIIISLCFAAFAILMTGGNKEKNKPKA